MQNIILKKVRAKTMIMFKMIVLTCVQVVAATYLFKLLASYRENYSMTNDLLANLPAIVIGNIYLIPLILMLIGLYQLSVAWGNTQIIKDNHYQ